MLFLFVDDLRGETMVPPSKKLDDLIHLAELCVDLLQQNEEHYAEVCRVHVEGIQSKRRHDLVRSSRLLLNNLSCY